MAKKKTRKSGLSKNTQAQSHLRQAVDFYNRQQFAAALVSYGKAIALQPDYAAAYYNRGLLYGRTNEVALALADFNQAIALKPDHAEAYSNRGLLYERTNEVALALADFNQAIALKPDYADAYCNRGALYEEFNEKALALADFNQAIALQPDFAAAYYNRGLLYEHANEKALALVDFQKAIALKPDFELAQINYATALTRLNQHHDAMEWYDSAIALNPDSPLAYYSKSFPLLLLGRFGEGLSLYEYRFQVSALNLRKMDVPGRRWSGEASLQGKTLLLGQEGGFGDTIQFCRYAKMASDMGAKVILQVQPSLLNLLKDLEGVDELIAHSEDLTLQTIDKFPPFDLYCPLMSLPFAFKTDLASIPGGVPYLSADPEKIDLWEKRLGGKTKPRVGLVWSGNAKYINDYARSIMLWQLLPYLPDNCEYISLQKEVRDIDKVILAAMPEWRHYGEELDDFSDTAALCSLMDVVVSVDTGVAHLSAALGKPTWIMLPFYPDWRWMLERRDSPWYPDVRLYRQNQPENWNDVFEEVRNDLLKIGNT